MLQWTATGPGRRLLLLVDHPDAEREFAYRVSPMGCLERALEEAHQRGWTVVSMKDDWKRIFPFERAPLPARRRGRRTDTSRGELFAMAERQSNREGLI